MPRFVYFTGASALFLTIADTAAKFASISHLSETKEIVLIPRVISLFLHKNYGAIANFPLPMVAIVTTSLIVLLFCVAFVVKMYRQSKYKIISAMNIVIIGAIGNLLDRVIHGFTTDYLLLFNISAVNISDGLILGGIIWLIVETRIPPQTVQS